MASFTPQQRAALRDAAARSRLEAAEQSAARAKEWQAARKAERAEKTAAALSAISPSRRRRKGDVLPPKSAQPPKYTRAEVELADRLMAFISAESTVDRRRHALGVARLITQGRRK